MYPSFDVVQDGKTPGLLYKEWAPAVKEASLVGDFNGWDVEANKCIRDDFVCSPKLLSPCLLFGTSTALTMISACRDVGAVSYQMMIQVIRRFHTKAGSKCHSYWSQENVFGGFQHGSGMCSSSDAFVSFGICIPEKLYCRHSIFEPEKVEYCGVHWAPPQEEQYQWKHTRPYIPASADYQEHWGTPIIPQIERPTAQNLLSGNPEYLYDKKPLCHQVDGRVTAKPSDPSRVTVFPSRSGKEATPVVDIDKSRRRIPRYEGASGLKIYEAHVGMSSQNEEVASYDHFCDNVLPRIKKSG